MLSLQKCRELLGPSAHLSDSELSALVNSLYVLAETAVRLHACAGREPGGRPLSADDQAEVDERAAIMEFDGQMSRADADRLARRKMTREKRPSNVN